MLVGRQKQLLIDFLLGVKNGLLELITTKSVNKRSAEGSSIYANKGYFQTKIGYRVFK